MLKGFAAAAVAFMALTTSVIAATPADAVTYKRYANCTALNKVFKHGVGKKGARDHTRGTRVTNFYVNTRLYNKNPHLDRDKDGIACEKR